MNGSVVKALTSTLASHGFMTLSFNYRGIGNSESDADIAIYQKEFWENSTSPGYEKKIFTDSETAFRFLVSASGAAVLSVVGYSFGTLPALELASRHEASIDRACLISPPVVKWDMRPGHFSLACPKAFYYAPEDFACPEDKLKAAYEKFREPKSLIKIDSRDHFYLGQEEELALQVAAFLK
jgi:alpha/beta superfamily hydrolase